MKKKNKMNLIEYKNFIYYKLFKIIFLKKAIFNYY